MWFEDELAASDISDVCPAEQMDAEDPLFILYTSGSTGKPKGVLHTVGGYMVYTYLTFKYIFDYKDKDIFFCSADIGWVTGHSYIVYGPLANGATSIVFESVPTFPNPDRFWQIVEKFKVTSFYTAPTAIRALMKEGEKWPQGRDLSSLKVLGSVGEPINPEAWLWYNKYVGGGKCPIVDTWWQTETGGILITGLPGAWPQKPGFASLPFFGVNARALQSRPDASKAPEDAPVNEQGELCIMQSWPGIMRGVFGEPERFFNTYFVQQPGCYFSGDGALKDGDGYFRLMGRIDDVVNVSGHRMGTAEVESCTQFLHHSGCRVGSRRLSARHQGRRPLCIRHPERWRRGYRCPEERAGGSCQKRDRSYRFPWQDPVRTGSAEDTFRQDHEKNPEKGRLR